jgi:hypothetical protein
VAACLKARNVSAAVGVVWWLSEMLDGVCGHSVICGEDGVRWPTGEGLEMAGDGTRFSFELITFGN